MPSNRTLETKFVKFLPMGLEVMPIFRTQLHTPQSLLKQMARTFPKGCVANCSS